MKIYMICTSDSTKFYPSEDEMTKALEYKPEDSTATVIVLEDRFAVVPVEIACELMNRNSIAQDVYAYNPEKGQS